MNGEALVLGIVAVPCGVGYVKVLDRTIAARTEGEMPDNDEELEYVGPFRHFSTGYLKLQRWVGYGVIAVGALLFVLALFS